MAATVAEPAPTAHPHLARPGEWFDPRLAGIAAELVGCIRDYGPDETARVLARANDRLEDLALTLAAMVDPDATPNELLAWTRRGPVPSRGEAKAPRWNGQASKADAACPLCGRVMRADHIKRHQAKKHGIPSEPARKPSRTTEERKAAQLASNKRKVICDCGSTVRAGNIARHRARSCPLGDDEQQVA